MKTIRLDIPNFMLEVLLKNPKGKKRGKEKIEQVQELISTFLSSPEYFKIPPEEFFPRAINASRKEKISNNFSFVITRKESELLKKQSTHNLRTEKMQGLYMMIIIFYHLINVSSI